MDPGEGRGHDRIDPSCIWDGLFLAATGPIVLASALIRGDAEPRRTGWWTWLGVAVATLAAVIGLYVWQPLAEWPRWFPLLWAPVLLVASLPLPTGQTFGEAR